MSGLFSRVYRKNNNQNVYVAGILGSPRIQGNCDILLDKALEGASATGARIEKIILNNFNFSGCLSCEDVRDDGNCKVKDDFQQIYRKLFTADIIIIASPIYFGSLTAQTKTMIDRFQCFWRAVNITKTIALDKEKRGGFICVQADNREDFFKNAQFVVKQFFAAIGVRYCEELFCQQVEEKASIKNRPECLKDAFALGELLVNRE
ncbi:MAG: flavodoxin family protein [Candidatus Omnitrophica bacterium]|nr:flavodoxin family protein [Candidatus Omnitrophota bacterium]